jgi:hypothetical protein
MRLAERNAAFLRFVHERGGICCLCFEIDGERGPFEEAHHFGPKGMGQKGSDYLVARVCRKHHAQIQGKRKVAFEREPGGWEILAALRGDALDLMIEWVEHLHGRRP